MKMIRFDNYRHNIRAFLSIMVMLVSTIGIEAQEIHLSYKETVEFAKKTPNVALLFGGIQDLDHRYNFSVGASVCYRCFYLDASFKSPKYGSTTNVGVWEDSKGFTFHLGYQIPIVYYFRVTPVIGMVNYSYGKTDGWDWTVDSGGVHNEYTAEEESRWFDYGISTQYAFNKVSRLTLNASITRRTFNIGLGYIF